MKRWSRWDKWVHWIWIAVWVCPYPHTLRAETKQPKAQTTSQPAQPSQRQVLQATSLPVHRRHRTSFPIHRRNRLSPAQRKMWAKQAEVGAKLYAQHCASCHHPQRRGLLGSPLLPQFLRRSSDDRVFRMISKGKHATQMPAFPQMSREQIVSIIRYLRTPGSVDWTTNDIVSSRVLAQTPAKRLPLRDGRDLRNVTAVVERGNNQVWLMENENILDRFAFPNIHGGIKFTRDGRRLFVPARDGWIGGYDLKEGRFFGKVRACVYLRNVAVTRDSRHLLASCWIPQAVMVFDANSLELRRTLPSQGQISAVYELHDRDEAIFTLRNKPWLGRINTKTWDIQRIRLDTTMADFFLDPLERFVVGTPREGKQLMVLDLNNNQIVFRAPVHGMPHLFSATFWYHDGKFFFATPHTRSSTISVWQMYAWKFVRNVATGGHGFFVRTHPATPYLWADNGSDALLLIDKQTFTTRRIVPTPGKRVLHTEFSGDGKIAYVSLFEPKGELALLDAITLDAIRRYPASIPVGKYNFVNKQRQNERIHWGREVFLARCWGCHHPTHTAFGPSFRDIGKKRHRSWILAQLVDPKITAKHLGYSRSAMPKMPLSEQEIEVLVQYIKATSDSSVHRNP